MRNSVALWGSPAAATRFGVWSGVGHGAVPVLTGSCVRACCRAELVVVVRAAVVLDPPHAATSPTNAMNTNDAPRAVWRPEAAPDRRSQPLMYVIDALPPPSRSRGDDRT